jgi:alanine racemase
MARHTRARVHLGALRHNFALASRLAGAAEPMAVVKADGYGHGLAEVVGALKDQAGRYAVACLEEAEVIRARGIAQPVVLLEGFHQAADIDRCREQRFEPVVHSAHQIDALASVARANGRGKEHEIAGAASSSASIGVWLKVNTGMNRLGFAVVEADARLDQLRQLAGVQVLGVMTHYACADDIADTSARSQAEKFADLAARHPDLWFSAANSAAHFHSELPTFDWTRPGIMLYGATPMLVDSAAKLGLQPALTLESEIIATRLLQPGDTVGYGATWQAQQETPMGIVSIGYGDGYPRHTPNGTPAWVNGKRVRTIGRISMDMLALDLSEAPRTAPGDRVELWGDHVPVDEVARHAGTIGYELLTGITARVPRVYEN